MTLISVANSLLFNYSGTQKKIVGDLKLFFMKINSTCVIQNPCQKKKSLVSGIAH